VSTEDLRSHPAYLQALIDLDELWENASRDGHAASERFRAGWYAASFLIAVDIKRFEEAAVEQCRAARRSIDIDAA
jgi:hypothetical protein